MSTKNTQNTLQSRNTDTNEYLKQSLKDAQKELNNMRQRETTCNELLEQDKKMLYQIARNREIVEKALHTTKGNVSRIRSELQEKQRERDEEMKGTEAAIAKLLAKMKK